MPIRILHILHSMNRGGAENAIMNYYCHIDREKVQFDFLLTEKSKCQFEDEILSLGGRVFRVPLLTIRNPFPYLKEVKRFLRSHPEYKIVHSHTSSKSFFPLWIAKKVGVPVRICHSHGSKSEPGSRGRIRDILKPLLKRVATHFFACGHDAAIWLYGDEMIREGRVVLFPNVIEASRFGYNEEIRKRIRLELGIEESSVVIGCTARFSAVKNHLFLISIFNEFHKLKNDSILLLVGDGELRDDLERQVIKDGLSDSVLFSGVVPIVNDYLQAMDIFMMPSFNEGLPLSLVEAQISGLRCFVSDRIPKESDITGLVSFLPLEKDASFWAVNMIDSVGYRRSSHIIDTINAGYDASTSAISLEEFYLEAYRTIH